MESCEKGNIKNKNVENEKDKHDNIVEIWVVT